jgi:hypothetical protein
VIQSRVPLSQIESAKDSGHYQGHRVASCSDMDSSVSPTHGEQEMSVWNGHYACTCYQPLFVFNQFGDQ